MQLRPFVAEDFETYLTFSRDFHQSPAVIHKAPDEFFKRTFEKAAAGSPFLAAWAVTEDGGPMIGYLIVCLAWSVEYGGLVAWLDELYLKAECRGRGLGRQVITEIMRRYKSQVAVFRLEVAPDHHSAIKLYRALGFEETGYLPMSRQC